MLEQMKFLWADLKRWKPASSLEIIFRFFEAGIWVAILYRCSRALFLVKLPIIKIIARIIAFILFKLSEILFGVSLPPSVAIGPGLRIGHTGLIIIHYEVKVGSHFNLAHGVTIGTQGAGKQGVPVLGNNVYAGAGAKILGPIKIGNNVRIGANAVVIHDIPDNATAVGVPARVIKR